MPEFKVEAPFVPLGDQPEAIAILPGGELALVDLNPLGDTAQTARDLRYSLVRQAHV